MNPWPLTLRPSHFRIAARVLLAGIEHGTPNAHDRGCALRSIKLSAATTRGWVEFYGARALFTAMYRPRGVKPDARWWPEGDTDARVIALLLAEQIAKDMN